MIPTRIPTLSLVFPIHNEEETIPLLRRELELWRKRHADWDLEFVLVDDGSTDRSAILLREWAAEDAAVTVLFLARNFGHQAAATAGLQAATGARIALLDADLQDPLAVLDEMMSALDQGYDIAYGQRTGRTGESFFKKTTAWLFYRYMKSFIDPRLPKDTGDFRMVTRRALAAVSACGEIHRFLRGLFAWVGFRQVAIPYQRAQRVAGSTKYPLRKMLSLAWTATLSFSIVPLRLMTLSGVAGLGFALLYSGYTFLRWLVWQDTVQGWPTVIILICFFGGMNLLSLGLLGEYLGRVYEEVKRRPLYIVADSISSPKYSQP